MKVLVTGGLGFVGSNLIKGLNRVVDQIVVVDNETGNISKPSDIVLSHADIKIINVNITDSSAIDSVIGKLNPDVVVHLAAISSVADCQKYPNLAKEVNIGGSSNIFRSAKRHGVKRLIYFSSSAIYGQAPLNIYARTKLSSEKLLTQYKNDLDITVFRPFNIYGPLQRAGVISKFIKSIFRVEGITKYGNAVRDYIYVEDVCDAVIKSIASDTTNGIKTMDVASGASTDTGDLISAIESASSRKFTSVQDMGFRDFEVKYSMCIDNSAIIELLGRKPISLKEGVKLTVEHYEENNNIS